MVSAELYTKMAGAGLSAMGGFLSARQAKKAAEEKKKRALAMQQMLKDAGDTAAEGVRKGANPLLQQALNLTQLASHQDTGLEQSLVAALRNQAGGAQQPGAEATGAPSSRRADIFAKLAQGQGLLAARTKQDQRFQQLSNMAANIRGQSASIVGRAAELRYQSRVDASKIDVPVDATSAWGVALTAAGGGMSDMTGFED